MMSSKGDESLDPRVINQGTLDDIHDIYYKMILYGVTKIHTERIYRMNLKLCNTVLSFYYIIITSRKTRTSLCIGLSLHQRYMGQLSGLA